uniref:Uncharacterized protein n=1 Tax=Rhizophora mucronata TaxID=61149 RepID=A0A2P2NWW2_RHIMU
MPSKVWSGYLKSIFSVMILLCSYIECFGSWEKLSDICKSSTFIT